MNNVLARGISIFVSLAVCSVTPTSNLTIQEQNEKPIELSGFSISQTYEVEDDSVMNLEEQMLIRLAYRIKKTSPKSRHEFSHFARSVSWEDVVEQTDNHRLWLFERKGRVNFIRWYRIPNTADDAEIKDLFICHCKTEQAIPFVVIANTIPTPLRIAANKPDSKLDEPIGFSGFLYSRSKMGKGDEAQPVFVADRLEWFPDSKHFDFLSDSHLDLAKSGFDIGLLDVVRKSNTRPLESRDAEAFYQMLATTKKAIRSSWDDGISFQELMQKASTCFGKPISISGSVRRCSIIHDMDQDIKNRLGIEKYYQMVLFPDLDGKKIVIKQKGGEEDVNDRFPITVCFAELPEGLQASDLERKKVRINGFVYRFWKFQSERTDQSGFAGQVSPLIMTGQPVLVVDTGAAKIDRIMMGFVLLVIGGIGGMIFIFRRSDRNQKSAGQTILDELPDEIDVAGITE